MSARRAFLRSLAAFPLASLPAMEAAPPNKMPELYQEAMALLAFVDHPKADAEASEQAMGRVWQLETEAMTTAPTSMAGVIASLEWLQADHLAFRMHNPDQGDRFTLALVDGAPGALRAGGVRV